MIPKSSYLLFYDFSMNYYAFLKFIKKSVKTKHKGKTTLHRKPWTFSESTRRPEHYLYESMVRIWNPKVYSIWNRGPLSPSPTNRWSWTGRCWWWEWWAGQRGAGEAIAVASYRPCPTQERAAPVAASAAARALLVGHGHGGAHSETSCEGEDGEQGVEEDVEASEWGSGEPFWLSQTWNGAAAEVRQWWGALWCMAAT